jgi:hypothetical protein
MLQKYENIQNILGTIMNILGTMATWHPGYVQACSRFKMAYPQERKFYGMHHVHREDLKNPIP